MHRRHYLALGATLTVAGCLGDDADDADGDGTDDDDAPADDVGDGDDTPPPDTGDETPTDADDEEATDDTDDDTDEPAVYTIDASVPAELEVGEEFTFSWSVVNQGAGEGSAWHGLDLSTASEDRWEVVFEEQIDLAPGEDIAHESDPTWFNQRATIQWEFWVDGPEGIDVAALETVVVSPERAWGDAYRTPAGFVLTADAPDMTDRYTFEGFDGDEVHHAADGMQFVFIDLAVANETDHTVRSPNILDFEVVADGTQYETMSRVDYRRDDMYGGRNDLASGVTERGVLPYEIPTDIDTVDLFHTSSDLDSGTSWEVTWG